MLLDAPDFEQENPTEEEVGSCDQEEYDVAQAYVTVDTLKHIQQYSTYGCGQGLWQHQGLHGGGHTRVNWHRSKN